MPTVIAAGADRTLGRSPWKLAAMRTTRSDRTTTLICRGGDGEDFGTVPWLMCYDACTLAEYDDHEKQDFSLVSPVSCLSPQVVFFGVAFEGRWPMGEYRAP